MWKKCFVPAIGRMNFAGRRIGPRARSMVRVRFMTFTRRLQAVTRPVGIARTITLKPLRTFDAPSEARNCGPVNLNPPTEVKCEDMYAGVDEPWQNGRFWRLDYLPRVIECAA
jgi:hypothetical protein